MGKYSKKQYLIAGAAAIAIAGAAGGAYAYWTSTGTGTGTATTGSSTPFTVSLTNDTASDLTPGGPTDTINFTVHNGSTGHQNLSSAVASVASVTANPAGGTCDFSDFSVSPTTITLGDIAGGGTVNGSFTIQMIDKPTVDQDGCQNATVNLQVVAS